MGSVDFPASVKIREGSVKVSVKLKVLQEVLASLPQVSLMSQWVTQSDQRPGQDAAANRSRFVTSKTQTTGRGRGVLSRAGGHSCWPYRRHRKTSRNPVKIP